jgi:hypothetical protein
MKMTARRARLIRRICVLVAAAPVFQSIGWCETAFNRTAANTVNALPSTYFSVIEGIALLPLRLLISGGNIDNFSGGGGF